MGAPDIWSSKFVVSGCCPGAEIDGAHKNGELKGIFISIVRNVKSQIAEAEVLVGLSGLSFILLPLSLSRRLTADG